jgi:hypothetical protein
MKSQMDIHNESVHAAASRPPQRRAEVKPIKTKPRPVQRCGQFRCTPADEGESLAADIEHLTHAQKSQLGRQFGYPSFDSMLAASRVVTLSDGSAWWLTNDRGGGWTAWKLCALNAGTRDKCSDGT